MAIHTIKFSNPQIQDGSRTADKNDGEQNLLLPELNLAQERDNFLGKLLNVVNESTTQEDALQLLLADTFESVGFGEVLRILASFSNQPNESDV